MVDAICNAIKQRTTFAFRQALRKTYSEFKLQRRHCFSVKRARKLFRHETHLKLNFACGSNIKSGWINIDLLGELVDLQLDLREELPFSDGSVSIIYSEHFLEHLEYPYEIVPMLRECWRVLEPGGVFSAGIPDFELAISSYITKDDEYYKSIPAGYHPTWCVTRMHHLNQDFRQHDEHKYAYDFETLEGVLTELGYEEVRRRTFDPALDSRTREWGTMYVDARKPKNAIIVSNQNGPRECNLVNSHSD
jgi:predicted SAM-dependent methyltransferase